MLAELVSVRTEDHVLLHGALFEPDTSGPVAVLLTHGGWGNFYTGLGRFLPGMLAKNGIACLSFNNRGHDYGTASDGEPSIGLQRELFEDSPKDIAAGLSLLKERKYHQIVLIGHSYGAAKMAYAQRLAPDPDVKAAVFCSPAALMRDTWKFYLDVPYEEAVQEVTRMVAAGQGEKFVVFRHHGPSPIICTAQTFLSVWGPNPAQDMCTFIQELSMPLLVTVCRREQICMDYSRAVYERAVNSHPRNFIVLPRGDHFYRGVEVSLAEAILDWLDTVGLR